MNASFYALDQVKPVLVVCQVRFFDVWTALKAELADFFQEDADSFALDEASWNGGDDYAEVVRLRGRIVGAVDRAITQKDLAAMWGIDRMQKQEFINRIRSLFNIDGDLLPEFTREQQSMFLANPVSFFLDADEAQSDAIMREIEARQSMAKRQGDSATLEAGQTLRDTNAQAVAKPSRKKKPKAKVDGQRELLLPITGGASGVAGRTQAPAAGRKAG